MKRFSAPSLVLAALVALAGTPCLAVAAAVIVPLVQGQTIPGLEQPAAPIPAEHVAFTQK